MILRHSGLAATVAALAASVVFTGLALAQDTAKATLDRGRHLVLIGHCNNCHTAGYAASNGKVAEAQWLMGNPLGWRGKNGTIYAPNLRIFVENLSESDWTRLMRTVEWRAPMPWWSVREHTDDELAAMYQYIKSLKPVGKPAPSFLPSDKVPPRPYQQLPDMS